MVKIVFILLLVLGCSTLPKKQSIPSSDNNDNANFDEEAFGSSSRRYAGSTYTVSLGLNKFAYPSLSFARINGLIDRIESKTSKTSADYEELVSLKAVARKPFSRIWSDAQKLAATMKTGKSIPDRTKLDLGISAIRARKFTVARYFLEDLSGSAKSPKIKAASLSGIGIMQLLGGNYQDAALSFKKSLSLYPSYHPSALNLGILQAKFGDFSSAKRSLSGVPNTWLVESIRLVVERHLGNTSYAASLCKKLLASRANHKATKVNCALLELEENRNFMKARRLLQDAVKIHGGGEQWDDVIYKLLEDIDNKEFNKQLQANK